MNGLLLNFKAINFVHFLSYARTSSCIAQSQGSKSQPIHILISANTDAYWLDIIKI